MEIQTSTRRAAKPDMTPLVDLGFLLITFFMYTTTFTTPTMMKFAQPISDNTGNHAPIRVHNTLTFILGENNRLYYYQQELNKLSANDIKEVSFTTREIGNLIKEFKQNAIDPDLFTVIIKPSEKSTYQNFVNILDEMMIFNQEHYSVVEISKKEEDFL